MKEIIATDGAPQAIGPYSQAVRAGDFLFLSGQIAIDPATGDITGHNAGDQTRQCLKNLAAVLEAAGGSMASVVKTTVYLHEMKHYAEVNEAYGEFFETDPPARAAVQVEALPREVLVEIDAIAYLGG